MLCFVSIKSIIVVVVDISKGRMVCLSPHDQLNPIV